MPFSAASAVSCSSEGKNIKLTTGREIWIKSTRFKSDARTRRTPKLREMDGRFHVISREALSECGASSHRFFKRVVVKICPRLENAV